MNSFAEVPFTPELLDMLFPSLAGSLKCVKIRNFDKVSELLNVDYDSFVSWPSAGKKKWAAFQEVQQFLLTDEGQAKVVDIYDCCIAIHRFPENLTIEQEELSLDSKIEIALNQYVAALQKISKYKDVVDEDLKRIKQLFIDKLSKRDAAKALGVTEETVRQSRSKLLKEMFNIEPGKATNLGFSDSIKQEIGHFLRHLPIICSKETLCKALQCDDYEESILNGILPLISAPEKAKSLSESPYSSFDQQYYISLGGSVLWAQAYIKAVCGVLGYNSKVFDVRPLSIDDIMSLLEKSESDFEFDRNVVIDLLEQHTWIESLIIDDEVRYQLKYKYLKKDYKYIARLVFEYKRLNINDIDALHRKKMNDASAASIANSKTHAKKNIPWVVYGGKNGIIEYNEIGVSRASLRTAVKEWAGSQTIFTIQQVLDAFAGMGYGELSEATIRTYLFESGSYVDNKDGNLFCHPDYVEKFFEGHSWRKKTQCGLNNWIIRKIYEYFQESSSLELSVRDVETKITRDAAASDEKYELRREIQTYLSPYMQGQEALFAYEKKRIMLTDFGRTLSLEDLSVIGLRSRKPDYYDVVVAKIVSLLNDSSNGELRLRDLQKECVEDIEGNTVASFYRVVNGYLPEQITKIYKEGQAYLRLEREKVEYVDSMVIKQVEIDNVQVESVVKENTGKPRPIREIGEQISIDWEMLRKDFCFQLEFYSRQLDGEMSFGESVEKFIRFIKQLNSDDNGRLAIQMPRNFMKFWHYQNDVYSYLGYLTDIVICYERLLREIYKANTGIVLETKGLIDTVNMIDDFRIWSFGYGSDFFRKTFKKLRYDRNNLSHGEEFSKSLPEIVLSTSQYIVLYIYTVSKFWNEKLN